MSRPKKKPCETGEHAPAAGFDTGAETESDCCVTQIEFPRLQEAGEEDERETGRLFRRGRRMLDLTQQQMAELLGVSKTKITSVENSGGQMLYRYAINWLLANPPPPRAPKPRRRMKKEPPSQKEQL